MIANLPAQAKVRRRLDERIARINRLAAGDALSRSGDHRARSALREIQAEAVGRRAARHRERWAEGPVWFGDGRIALPERCANLCFGGLKRNRQFMASSQSIYALYVNTQGAVGG